jgi:plasmid stabilization system protein ParE
MATYRLTRRARRDLLEIWQRIAEDDESAADRFIDLLIHHFHILGACPRIGLNGVRA